nr:salt stress-responsive protein YocM [Bacillus subtilis]
MDFEKMKQWMEFAQQMYGGDFWKQVFDEDQKTPFMTNGQSPFPFAQEDQRGKGDASFPSMDIVDTVTEVQFLIYLPGYRKQDVHILSYGDYLVVKGRRFSYFNEQDFRQKEGKYGSFEKKIPLSDHLHGKMNAIFKDGILYITIQKDEGQAKTIVIDD